jgi:hypothetical protein
MLQKQRMWLRTFFKNGYRNYMRSQKEFKWKTMMSH